MTILSFANHLILISYAVTTCSFTYFSDLHRIVLTEKAQLLLTLRIIPFVVNQGSHFYAIFTGTAGFTRVPVTICHGNFFAVLLCPNKSAIACVLTLSV